MPELSTLTSTALAQLPFTLLVISAVFALLTLSIMPKPHSGSSIIEVIFRSYLFWTLTLVFALDAVRFGAFGPDAAAVVGPVASADLVSAHLSLAFAVVSFLAIGGSLGLRTAAVVGIAVTLLAPYASAIPTADLIVAHATEVATVAIGLVLLLLQASGVLSRAPRERARPVEIDLGPAVQEPAE